MDVINWNTICQVLSTSSYLIAYDRRCLLVLKMQMMQRRCILKMQILYDMIISLVQYIGISPFHFKNYFTSIWQQWEWKDKKFLSILNFFLAKIANG